MNITRPVIPAFGWALTNFDLITLSRYTLRCYMNGKTYG